MILSGVVERWRRNVGKHSVFSVASEAEKVAIGYPGFFRGFIEFVDFNGSVVRKIKTKDLTQIAVTSDASKIYLLSAGGKIFSYNYNGEKLRKYKGGNVLKISDDGSMLTNGDILMDEQGKVLFKPFKKQLVCDVFTKELKKKIFLCEIDIAPSGRHILVSGFCHEDKFIYPRLYHLTYEYRYVYIRPESIALLLKLREKERSSRWRCIPWTPPQLSIDRKVCLQDSFIATALIDTLGALNIQYFDIEGNLKQVYRILNPQFIGEIKQFYATPNAKYIFYTLKGKERKKNIYIFDVENRKLMIKTLDIKGGIDDFKTSKDGRNLFIFSKGELIAFNIH